jgi:hypothetical protein
MLTITNNLPTHLVIPGGAGEGVTLKVPPRGKVQVERVTATLKDAERRGLLTVGYPEASSNGDRPGKGQAKKKGTPAAPEGTGEPKAEETT